MTAKQTKATVQALTAVFPQTLQQASSILNTFHQQFPAVAKIAQQQATKIRTPRPMVPVADSTKEKLLVARHLQYLTDVHDVLYGQPGKQWKCRMSEMHIPKIIPAVGKVNYEALSRWNDKLLDRRMIIRAVQDHLRRLWQLGIDFNDEDDRVVLSWLGSQTPDISLPPASAARYKKWVYWAEVVGSYVMR